MVTLNLERQNGISVKSRPEAHTNLKQSEMLVITICENEPDLKSAVKNSSNSYVIRDRYLAQALLNISTSSTNASPITEITPLPRENDVELSNREEEVLELVAKGESNKAIAASLFISENTVKTHLSHIMTKLEVANRSQAAVHAIKTKLVHLQ